MDKVINSDILEGTGNGNSSDQKESLMHRTPRKDVTRQVTKADSLFSTVFWSQKVRAPSSLVQ